MKPTRVDDKNYRYYDQSALLKLQEIRLLKSISASHCDKSNK
ncbi:hypothetical protein [Laceyella sacchari]